MELSINFIVMLIIALAVFGMGLTLFRKFFIQAEDIQENLDLQTEEELKQIMMSSPDQVVIYPTKLTVRKGKGGVFGIGVLNIGAADNVFTISTTFDNSSCYNKDGTKMECDGTEIKVVPQINRTIKSNERQIIEVPVRTNNQISSGKYAVKVVVTQGANPLSINLIYIEVP